jgi:CRISPR system Cascade subunit CasB
VTEKARLISYLERLVADGDRGALAALRRGLGKPPGTEVATFPHVVPCIPEADQGPARSWPYFVVASLFAAHPVTRAGENLGASYRRMKESPSREARFRALLNAHPDDLPGHLRHAVSQLGAQGIGVDWSQLLMDLRFWSDAQQRTQLRWARAFWADTTQETSQDGRPTDVR